MKLCKIKNKKYKMKDERLNEKGVPPFSRSFFFFFSLCA